jgi:hypothetical protein
MQSRHLQILAGPARLEHPRRYRNRDHLRFVTQQPCLLCGRKPSDAFDAASAAYVRLCATVTGCGRASLTWHRQSRRSLSTALHSRSAYPERPTEIMTLILLARRTE